MSDITLTEDAIFCKLLALNGSGPDVLHPQILKSCFCFLSYTTLFLLAQQSLTSGLLPDLWKRAHFTSIHKREANFNHPIIVQSASHLRWLNISNQL